MKIYIYIFYIYMPENLYPKLPSVPSISQESFNVVTIRKYYQDITYLRNKYEKERKYKNSYNKLLHASTGSILYLPHDRYEKKVISMLQISWMLIKIAECC